MRTKLVFKQTNIKNIYYFNIKFIVNPFNTHDHISNENQYIVLFTSK